MQSFGFIKGIMTRSEIQKRFKERNPDRWNEIRRNSYAKHRTSRRAKEKTYRDNNHEKLLARKKQYYAKNKEVLTAQQRQRNKTVKYKIHLWKKRKVWKLDVLIFILFYKWYATEMQYARLSYHLRGRMIKQLPSHVARGRITAQVKNIYGVQL